MAAQADTFLTPEQYLEIERDADLRHEYYNGRMYAMAGGSHTHALIIANLARELGIALKKGPCLVTTSDLRVRISARHYSYPDIVVVCDEPKYADGHRDTVVNPVLVVEVLSPSTEAYDRGLKSKQYREVESLQEYALLSQTEHRIEVFRRQKDGTWLLSESAGAQAQCRFESVACTIPLSEIYDKVTFSGPATNPPGEVTGQ